MSVRVPKYRRHKGSGQALVEVNGRRIYLGKYNSPASREAYRRLVADLMSPQAEVALAPPPGAPHLVLDELVLQYFRYAKTYYVKHGELTDEIASIRSALRRLRAMFGATPVVQFGPLAFKKLRESMIQEGLSRKYINDSMARVRRMFRWGVAEELIPAATYQALASVAGLRRGRSAALESKRVLPVEEEVVKLTLPFLPGVIAAMVQLQQLAGMRPAEVCVIRPCDIDCSSEVWVYRPHLHKCEHIDQERVVLLGPQAQAILGPYLARDPQTYCFRPSDSERRRREERHALRKTPLHHGNRPGVKSESIPLRPPGESYSVDSYRRAIHRACDKAFPHPLREKRLEGGDHAPKAPPLAEWQRQHRWSPNQLRHFTATKVRREFGLEAAQVILGHSAADVTQIYAERDLSKGFEVARKIG